MAIASAEPKSPKSFRVACIGVGGQGWINSRAVARHASVTAICDVDLVALNRARQNFVKAQVFDDPYDLFAHPNLYDGVVISTPDHTHSNLVLSALRLEKHCYCEKPLSATFEGNVAIAAESDRRGVATFLGCQAIVTSRFRVLTELIANRCTGRSTNIEIWTDRPGKHWNVTEERANITAKSGSDINWNAWLGGVGNIPYSSCLHPIGWRKKVGFGTGALGDMGPHLFALPFIGLGLKDFARATPLRVSARKPELFPDASILRFKIKSNDATCHIVWSSGGKRPIFDTDGIRISENGMRLVCDDFELYSPEWNHANPFYRLEGKWTRLALPPFTEERFDQFEYWINCAQKSLPSIASFKTFGVPLNEMLLCGILAEVTNETVTQSGFKNFEKADLKIHNWRLSSPK